MRTYDENGRETSFDYTLGDPVVGAKPTPKPVVLPARLGNRHQRRTWRRKGLTLGKVVFRSVRVERADGSCICRELRR